uniref:FXYD domain-containing ion transport regulator n=1 Tax=Oryzias melastigma TaxID=30732 RepID=A0A3B3CQ04_ORYME
QQNHKVFLVLARSCFFMQCRAAQRDSVYYEALRIGGLVIVCLLIVGAFVLIFCKCFNKRQKLTIYVDI